MRCMMLALLGAAAAAAAVPQPLLDWPDTAGRNDRHDSVWLVAGAAGFAAGPTRVELDAHSGLQAIAPIAVPEAFSVEVVFRADRVQGNLQIISAGVFAFAEDAPAFAGDRRLWCLEVRGEGPNLAPAGFLALAVKGAGGGWHKILSHGRLAPGWHHAVGVCSGQAMQLYLDGVPQTRTPRPGEEQMPDGLLLPKGLAGITPVLGDGVGRRTQGGHRGAGNGLDGAVAALRLHAYALTAAAVADLHAQARHRFPDLARQVPPRERLPKAPFRVLFSNDFTNTAIVTPWHAAREPFKLAHLEASVAETAGAEVHLLQPAHGQVPWWPSRVYPLAEHHRWWAERYGIPVDQQAIPGVHRVIMDGGDPFAVFLDAARAAGQRAFISMRLNDTHHTQLADEARCDRGYHAFGRFYADHPEYRLGGAGSGLNWAIPAVRDVMFSYIREICESYDLDGLELDFMRFPSFFKPDVGPAERQRILTEFVARVSGVLGNRSADARKRWLCARVPATFARQTEVGIYLPDMVDAGLDVVTLSNSYFTDQRHDLGMLRSLLPDTALHVEMCHATMVGKTLTPGGGDNFRFLRTTDQQYVTTAHLAYRRGADGVSLFNFVYTREHGQRPEERGPWNEPPFHVLERLGDPDWLAQQPQWYVLANTWDNDAFPRSLEAGVAITCGVDMAPTEHQTHPGLLRLMTREECDGDGWFVAVNGMELALSPPVARPLPHPYDANLAFEGHYTCFALPRQAVRDGINHVAIMRRTGRPVALQYLDATLP